jgi:hypothetical protein
LHHLSNGGIGARAQEFQETTIETKVLPHVAAIQVSIDDLADNRPPEAMLIGEAIAVHTFELIEVVFDQSVKRRGFGTDLWFCGSNLKIFFSEVAISMRFPYFVRVCFYARVL